MEEGATKRLQTALSSCSRASRCGEALGIVTRAQYDANERPILSPAFASTATAGATCAHPSRAGRPFITQPPSQPSPGSNHDPRPTSSARPPGPSAGRQSSRANIWLIRTGLFLRPVRAEAAGPPNTHPGFQRRVFPPPKRLGALDAGWRCRFLVLAGGRLLIRRTKTYPVRSETSRRRNVMGSGQAGRASACLSRNSRDGHDQPRRCDLDPVPFAGQSASSAGPSARLRNRDSSFLSSELRRRDQTATFQSAWWGGHLCQVGVVKKVQHTSATAQLRDLVTSGSRIGRSSHPPPR